MKKNLNLWLLTALVCGLSFGVTSCKDDDSTSGTQEVTISNELLSHGVETDIQSAVIEVPIKANGTWTATLTKGTDWCKILDWQVTYQGDQTLKLAIDENQTQAGRSCELTIGNGEEDDYKVIKIYQNNTLNGEDPTNGSGLAFAGKGVGTGIDYDYLFNVKAKQTGNQDFSPTMMHGVNNIFNITRIEELIAEKKLNPSAYVEAPIPFDDFKAALLDSCISQSKELDVSLEIGISFGVIEFTGKGGYNSKKREGIAHIDYSIIRNAPMYNVYLSPAELSNYAAEYRKLDIDADDRSYEAIDALIEHYKAQNEKRKRKNLNEDGLTAAQAAEIDAMYDAIPVKYDHAGIFSAAFGARYNDLYNAIIVKQRRGEPIDSAAANRAMALIDAAWGPFYIAGGNFGGMMAIHARVDTLRQEGLTSFGGSVSVGALAGAISVSGGFKFTEEGYNMMHDINPDIKLYGGDAKPTTDALVEIITGSRPNDFTKWGKALTNWIESMKSPDGVVSTKGQSQAAIISMIIQPVWQLFDEGEIHEYAKNYFMKEYAECGIDAWMDMIRGGIQPNADDLLNADSDFWKKYTSWKWSKAK